MRAYSKMPGWRLRDIGTLDVFKKRENFQHKPLESPGYKSIRLLKLQSGKPRDPITCTLEEVRLESLTPEYEALSYVWGSLHKTQKITCNEGEMLVTANLFDALKAVRLLDTERSLWIDQICIDQSNTPERSYQVTIMGEIFSSAQKVLVWLGPHDSTSKFALPFMHSILQMQDAELEKNPLHLKSSEMRAISLLSGRTWFSRAWTIQEVALARSIEILIGNDSIRWEAWTKLEERLRSRVFYSIDMTPHSNVFNHDTIWSMQLINQIRRDRKTEPSVVASPIHPFTLLCAALRLKASDPRDLIYAVLNLSPTKLMDIDYERSYADIVPEFVIQHVLGVTAEANTPIQIPHVVTETLLKNSGAPYRGWDIPSWIPDRRKSPAAPPMSCQATHCYNAGGPPNDFLGSIHRDHTIHLDGKVYDTIAQVGTTWFDEAQLTDETNLKDVMSKWISEAGSFLPVLPAIYPTGESRNDVYKRTFLANHFGSSNCYPPMSKVQEIFDYIRAYVAHEVRSYHSEKHHEMYAFVTGSLRRRVFFISKRGFMGLAPAAARPGHRVVVFRGLDAPYVLEEERGRRFRLVGDAYVHGFMEGQVMHDSSVALQDVVVI